MKTAPFRYARPRNLDEALDLLRDEDAKPLAGGQSLVPMMAMRLARPSVLVDLSAIPELGGIERRAGERSGVLVLEQLEGLVQVARAPVAERGRLHATTR